MLIHLYAVNVWGETTQSNGDAPHANGRPKTHRRDRRVRDAEEFELEGLISEDEDAEPLVDKQIHDPDSHR